MANSTHKSFAIDAARFEILKFYFLLRLEIISAAIITIANQTKPLPARPGQLQDQSPQPNRILNGSTISVIKPANNAAAMPIIAPNRPATTPKNAPPIAIQTGKVKTRIRMINRVDVEELRVAIGFNFHFTTRIIHYF
jgi:hypothetical protein